MPKIYKEKSYKKVLINFEVTQAEYLQGRKNYNRYVRWLLNEDPDYKKFMKEKGEASK